MNIGNINIENILSVFQAQRRQMIIDYLLTHCNPLQRTQINILRDLGMSQATLVKCLAELKGEGLIVEKPFGTATVYELLYDVAIERGLINKKYEIFDYNTVLVATKQPSNQEWTGKVFNFGDMVYIYAKHRDGFTISIPIYDKDWKELIQGAALGLNVVAFITAIVNYFRQK